jgi:hypothetical protein
LGNQQPNLSHRILSGYAARVFDPAFRRNGLPVRTIGLPDGGLYKKLSKNVYADYLRWNQLYRKLQLAGAWHEQNYGIVWL